MIRGSDDLEELPNKTILLLLREAAMNSRNDQFRKTAKLCADNLSTSIDVFSKNPTYKNLIDVNGLFSVAHRILRLELTSPDGGGGRVRQAKLEKVKAIAA